MVYKCGVIIYFPNESYCMPINSTQCNSVIHNYVTTAVMQPVAGFPATQSGLDTVAILEMAYFYQFHP